MTPSARSRASWRASSIGDSEHGFRFPQRRAELVAGREARTSIRLDGFLLGDNLLADGGNLRTERLDPPPRFAERQPLAVGFELDEHVASAHHSADGKVYRHDAPEHAGVDRMRRRGGFEPGERARLVQRHTRQQEPAHPADEQQGADRGRAPAAGALGLERAQRAGERARHAAPL